MKFGVSEWYKKAACGVMVIVAAVAGAGGNGGVYAQEVPPTSEEQSVSLAAPSLHNPGFDNHDWYEFNKRYQGTYPNAVWLPDDDGNTANNIPDETRQDWVMWFLDGRDIVDADPESSIKIETESVKIRGFSTDKTQVAGLYQVVRNTIPCATYQFQMYAQSRPVESNDVLSALQIGIEPTGWKPASKTDPAVHSFPATMVWGTSQKYINNFGQLSVTADAKGTAITVFTYGDALGGSSHAIYWESGSFADVTPAQLIDPSNASGQVMIDPAVIPAVNSAGISWSTPSMSGFSQVFYRAISTSSSGNYISPTMSYVTYLPILAKEDNWHAMAVNKTVNINHYFTLTNLYPGTTYEYIVVTRGLYNGSCTNWISTKKTFTTPQS